MKLNENSNFNFSEIVCGLLFGILFLQLFYPVVYATSSNISYNSNNLSANQFQLFSPRNQTKTILFDSPITTTLQQVNSPTTPSSPSTNSINGGSNTNTVTGITSDQTTQIGTCTITSFSTAQGEQFLNSVYGFSANQITDRQNSQLLNNGANSNSGSQTGVAGPINVNIYNGQSQTQTIPISTLSEIIGVSPSQIATDLNVPANSSVTLIQANQIPQAQSKMSSILSFLSGQGSSSATTSNFANKQITFPNGKSIALSDLFKLQKIDANLPGTASQSCLLNNAFIQGRVSFMALLNSNLLINTGSNYPSTPNSQVSSSSTVQSTNQHIDTSQFYAGLNNYDGNVVIPREYEKYLAAVKIWSSIDTLASTVGAIVQMTSLTRAKSQIETEQKQLDEVTQQQNSLSTLRSSIYAGANNGGTANVDVYLQLVLLDDANELAVPYSIVNTGPNSLINKCSTTACLSWLNPILRLNQGSIQSAFEFDPTLRAELFNKIYGTSTFDWKGANIDAKLSQLASNGYLTVPPDQLINTVQNYKSYTVQQGPLLNDITKLRDGLPALEKSVTFFGPRALSNFAFGLLWLGPGRLAFNLAGNIFFSSLPVSPNSNGSWLLIYAGTSQVATAFQTSSDWFLSGQIFQAISDFTKSGVPSKVFDEGNVFIVQDSAQTSQEQQEVTSISNTANNWNISYVNWPGQSQATFFEDVRDNKPVTSLGIYENNSVLGGTIQNQQSLSNYYQTLYWLVPLLAWKLTPLKGVGNALSLVARLGVQDLYINDWINPATVTPQTACSDAQVNDFIRGYEEATSVSLLQDVVATQPKWISDLTNSIQSPTTKSIVSSTIGALGYNYPQNTYIGKWIGIPLNFIDPVSLWKSTAAENGFTYVSSCHDISYKVLAFQNLDSQTPSSSIGSLTSRVSNPLGLPDLSHLSIASAFSGLGSNTQQQAAASLPQLLNLKLVNNGQTGYIQPISLYSFYLDPSSTGMNWFNSYSNACLRNCMVDQATNSYVCTDSNGCYTGNSAGNSRYICSQDQARMQELTPFGTVIPNKLISTSLTCGSSPVLQATGTGSLNILQSNCAATTCTLQSLNSISGRNSGNDLSNVMGNVLAVYTDKGLATFSNSQISFIYSSLANTQTPSNTNPLNTQTPSPSTNPLNTQTPSSNNNNNNNSVYGQEFRFPSLTILGNGQVEVTNYTSSSVPSSDQLGTLRTIETQNGVIQYDPTNQELHIALYSLDQVQAGNIKSISAAPTTIASSKSSYSQLLNSLSALLNKINNGQALSASELDLLRQALTRPVPSDSNLSPAQKQVLDSAIVKQASNLPLTAQEQNALTTAEQNQPNSGVLVLTPAQQSLLSRALTTSNTPNAQNILDTISSGQPLSSSQQAATINGVNAASTSGAISPSDAGSLNSAITASVPSSQLANQVSSELASNTPLTSAQISQVSSALQREQQIASNLAQQSPNGNLPAIQLGGAIDNVGGQAASSLNSALNKIGGLTTFSTPTSTYQITHDSSGNAVLNTLDKNTGNTTTDQITGPATQSGNSVVIPTNKGPFNFTVNMNPNSGQPSITVNSPQGSSTSPLILAQGPGGLLYYDAQTGTWKALNGLGIPSNSNFAAYGAQFTGSSSGTTATPGTDPFGYSNLLGSSNSTNPLLSLPSWPDNSIEFVLMFVVVLGSLLAIRMKKVKIQKKVKN